MNGNTQVADINTARLARTRPKELIIIPCGEQFIASVACESMSGAGIHAGDRLKCERAGDAEQGKLAIVRTPYGVMLRFYYLQPDYTMLESGNPHYPTLILPHAEAEVIGRPVKLERVLREPRGEGAA